MNRPSSQLEQLSETARGAVYRRDWPTVAACSRAILGKDGDSPEGHFLAGLSAKAAGRHGDAAAHFERALAQDGARYDAAIELANEYVGQHRHAEAAALVRRCGERLSGSPAYLHMAGTVLASAGLPEDAWPLFARAHALQPGVDLFRSSLATCSIFLGRIDEARAHYLALLERLPDHQRYHYQLSRLGRATDARHVEAMEQVLARTRRLPKDNVFLYYALGKELEDLERWDEAFDWFRRAGDAVTAVAEYDVGEDVDLIDTIVSTCSASWV
ncbi:MAG TPA: tetratricopeptide repeat protein, partial [Woeseiaceae bacterium]|nr:tetratricopeptide repeat protein [Woeseiaceae bacterium]